MGMLFQGNKIIGIIGTGGTEDTIKKFEKLNKGEVYVV
jgi:sugar diacid utilization regulator